MDANMMINKIVNEIIVMLPLILLNIGLIIFCIVKIRKEGVATLNKVAWSLIVIFISVIGPVSYLMLGRKKDLYDSYE